MERVELLLHNEATVMTAVEIVAALDLGTSRQPRKYRFTLEPYDAKRSETQNNEYWGYIITPAAEQLGYESNQDLHEQVCGELYGWREVPVLGSVAKLQKPQRTLTWPKQMTRKEQAQHSDRAAALLTAQGVLLPARETWHA